MGGSSPCSDGPYVRPLTCECETMSRMRLNFFRCSSSHTQASRSRWLVGSSCRRKEKGFEPQQGFGGARAWERRRSLFEGLMTPSLTPPSLTRSRQVGSMKSARASAMRILQPPLNSRVFLALMSEAHMVRVRLHILVRIPPHPRGVRTCISAVNPRPWRIEAALASVVSPSSSSSLCWQMRGEQGRRDNMIAEREGHESMSRPIQHWGITDRRGRECACRCRASSPALTATPAPSPS